MGYYIPNDEPIDKKGAEQIPCQPESLSDIPEDMALVCEVDNVIFKANALIYSENELRDFTRPNDNRRRRWFMMEKKKAHSLSGYKGDF